MKRRIVEISIRKEENHTISFQEVYESDPSVQKNNKPPNNDIESKTSFLLISEETREIILWIIKLIIVIFSLYNAIASTQLGPTSDQQNHTHRLEATITKDQLLCNVSDAVRANDYYG